MSRIKKSNMLTSVRKAIATRIDNVKFLHDLKTYMTTKSLDNTGFSQEVEADLKKTIRGPLRFGMWAIGIGASIFLLWGGFAPLDSAAVAEGIVTVAGKNKTLQHLEGGIITKIFVRDGQKVRAGDVLIELNESNARAQLEIITSQLNFAVAVQARLMAEQRGDAKINWNMSDFYSQSEDIAEIIKTQDNLFRYKRDELNSNSAILNERSIQKQEEIKSLEVREKSLQTQIKLLSDELASTEELYKKGLALRPKLLELRRYVDELHANLAETRSRIAIAKEGIEENNLHHTNIENDFQKELAKELKENHALMLDLMQKYYASLDVVERTKITAPVDGIVTDLQYHTVGGVIAPGHKIMEVVPQNVKLIVEAKVRTQDIDSIYPGLIARVQLGAYKSRLVPRLDGMVTYVSADKVADQPNMPPYYIAKIEIDEAQIASLNAEIKLQPGMPATVFIVKGTRTFLEYMISPIRDSFYKAFKEA